MFLPPYLLYLAAMELVVPAKWLLPEIMEFAALALLMTAKSQVSGFGRIPCINIRHVFGVPTSKVFRLINRITHTPRKPL